MSAPNTCPVCGAPPLNGYANAFTCGDGAPESLSRVCSKARSLAIERGDEVKRLKDRIAELEQTSGDLCQKCHWRGVRGDGCEFCRLAELAAEVKKETRDIACEVIGFWSPVEGSSCCQPGCGLAGEELGQTLVLRMNPARIVPGEQLRAGDAVVVSKTGATT